ncbi:ATP-binding protein [Streptomyces sp. CHD11]|uniref:ATP-binding protein n=1 Tax=Streptomyces sp. CHD11 TaxID=2741325 RepID=UPI001BFC0B40|nr:ATP-binding protein [Streptomyces sp. CHD11]MBT3153332.1 ATP-binding protein [Streptomyces sp. CHD11]
MDPNNPGPEEYGHDDGDTSRSWESPGPGADEARGSDAPRQRPAREHLTSDFGQHAPALARTVQLVSGDFLLTVNPVDGGEIEHCPPTERPARPAKLTEAERAEVERAARPPVPPGPTPPTLPLLARQDEREKLVRLLARGRSVRLAGPPGSGRTRLLDIVAEDCADLAPDGVVRLNGLGRSADDLLYELFYAVHDAPLHRPDRDELTEWVRDIGAVVVLDDLELGGAALDALLEATPECAFLFGVAPDVPEPSAEAGVEEVVLPGLDRAAGLDLLEHAVGRGLTEDESNWAGDLWFESEGLPLRFVQAGALLRQRDRLRAGTSAVDEFGVFEDVRPDETPYDPAADDSDDVPLPSLGEAAAPAPLLASRLSTSARATLRFAVALGGEVPHQAHLPALVGDTHADAALGELAACGLVSPTGSRFRLAAGVPAQLEAAGYADEAEAQVRAAAQHYAWWTGHPSVTPERVCAEADAVLAALAVLSPLTSATGEGEPSTAVQLARTAAPAFASGLHWSAWECALRAGAEAARLAGDVGEQAYFHHELGIHALCAGQLDRARTELEASIGLRGALADKRGTVAGRRALALVADRSGIPLAIAPTAGEEVPDAQFEESASPPRVPTAFPELLPPAETSLVMSRTVPSPAALPAGPGGGLKSLAKRNLVAAGAGALLVAVLGTVVTLGATSENDAGTPSENVGVNPSASQGIDDGSLGADPAAGDDEGDTGDATSRPTDPGADGTLGTSDDPAPTAGEPDEPSDDASGTKKPGDQTKSPSKSPSKTPPDPTTSASPDPSGPDPDPDPDPDPSGPETSPDPSDSDPGTTPPGEPSTSDSASGTAPSIPVETDSDADTPQSTGVGTPSSQETVI